MGFFDGRFFTYLLFYSTSYDIPILYFSVLSELRERPVFPNLEHNLGKMEREKNWVGKKTRFLFKLFQVTLLHNNVFFYILFLSLSFHHSNVYIVDKT